MTETTVDRLSLCVALRIKPDQVERFLAAFQGVVDGARNDEEGCLQYDLSRHAEQPNVFHVYEVYRDEAALQAHRDSAHFVAWSAVAPEVLEADGRTIWPGVIVSRADTEEGER